MGGVRREAWGRQGPLGPENDTRKDGSVGRRSLRVPRPEADRDGRLCHIITVHLITPSIPNYEIFSTHVYI